MLKGVFPVVPTPLFEDESVDHEGLARLIDFYVENSCHGLLVLGSGGEFPYFTIEEKYQIVKTASESNRNRLPLIAGCGFFSSVETIEFIENIKGLSVSALLVALPTYYKPSFDDVFNYYKAICDSSHLPLLYYHYPQMTGLNFDSEQLKRLMGIENIHGVKSSSMNLREMYTFAGISSEKDFDLFAGVSFLLKETVQMLGSGVICPVASIDPRLVVECYNAYLGSDNALAKVLQERINSYMPLTNTFSVPEKIQKAGFVMSSRSPFTFKKIGTAQRHAITKEALRLKGLPITAKVRSPLAQLKDRDKAHLKLWFEGFGQDHQ